MAAAAAVAGLDAVLVLAAAAGQLLVLREAKQGSSRTHQQKQSH